MDATLTRTGPALPVLTAPHLAREALALPEQGQSMRDPFLCPLCASHRPGGSIGLPFPFGINFSDWANLTGVFGQREGPLSRKPVVCGDCIPFMNKPMMALLGAAMFTTEGGFGLRGNSRGTVKGTFTGGQTILHLILYPPEPPFVATVNSGAAVSLAHLLWRTPVTLDKRLIRLRFGNRLLTIRRRVLDATLAIAERLELKASVPADPAVRRGVQAAEERGELWTRYRKMRALFAPNAIDYKLTNFQTGQPNAKTYDACTPEERRHLLMTLGLGEHNAIAYLTGNHPPVTPPPMILPDLKAADTTLED